MRKLLLIGLGAFCLAAPTLADFTFPAFDLVDVRTDWIYTELAGAPAGEYGSYTVTYDWTNPASTYAYSSEAEIGFHNTNTGTPGAYLAAKAPTSGASASCDPASLTFAGKLDAHYLGGSDPFYFAGHQRYYNASYGDMVTWSNITVTLHDYVPPTPQPWPGTEGFEIEVPPGGWTRIASAGHSGDTTWYQADSAYEGDFNAQVLYDYNQDELLISPVATAVAGMQLSGYSAGSIYWGTPASQGGTYDNYDCEVWIVRGGEFGGGDDTFIGKTDDTWVVLWQYEQFSYNLDDYGLTPGEQFQIAFRYIGNDGAQLMLDAVTLTPEPASLLLLGLGLLGLRRR